ncbi:uncharacterized protein LOC135127960 [Zophobas morio]|uniref:uncharacterized protein LOC135127960 n=1 Tax=Zophobas morio TaxID=2755281 RepID=UPI0030837946
MAVKLKEARAMRALAYNQMVETHDVASSALVQTTLKGLFSFRYQRVEEVVQDFRKYHAAVISCLSSLTEPDFESEDAVRKEFDRLYCETGVAYGELFPASSALNTPTPSDHSQTRQNNIRLPKISLRNFDGDFVKWYPFIQTFNTAIHNNESLPPVDKFQYLLSCLSGEALNLIKSLTLSEDNYPIAYKILTDRYDDKRKLAAQFFHGIMSIPKLTRESAKALRSVLDSFKEHRGALEALKIADNLEDFLWFSILLDKVDVNTRKAFEAECRIQKIDFPTREDLENFIESHCKVLDCCPDPTGVARLKSFNLSGPKSHNKASFVVTSNSVKKCPLCTEIHNVVKCPTFVQASPFDRYSLIKPTRTCFNCLKEEHAVSKCPSKGCCRDCGGRHHTLLHFKSRKTSHAPSEPDTTEADTNRTPSESLTSCIVHSLVSPLSYKKNILLATIVLEIRDRWGNFQTMRALLDPGSQASFIESASLNKLGLLKTRSTVSISGVGQIITNASYITSTQIRPRKSRRPTLDLEFHVLPRICGKLPASPIDPSQSQFSRELDLADPSWYKPGSIDVLLGADVYSAIVCNHMVDHTATPAMVKTIFGWALLGPIQSMSLPSMQALHISLQPSLNDEVQNFWSVEEVPFRTIVAPSDSQAEAIFRQSIFRDPGGRFGVALPFKTDVVPSFVDSKAIADRRLLALERRLSKQPDIRALYLDFMRDYLTSNHMSLLTDEFPEGDSFYIPHHGIIKPEGNLNKIRVVFDASCKASNNISLNDTILIGPKLQADIAQLLLVFRMKPVAFTCDIRQMYRQILIAPEHRRFQLIRFRFDASDPIQSYQLNTVTYGVASAPFLAIRTLLHLADLGHLQFPLASKALRENLYVDDLVCCSESLEEATELKSQLIQLLSSACFELRKWASNCVELLEDIPEGHKQLQPSNFDKDLRVALKVLGLQWDAACDNFSFSVKPNDLPCTKRNILSEIARIYDPLGFLCPVSFLAKYIIQLLWKAGVDWDQEVPISISQLWNNLKEQLPTLSSVKIPRHVPLVVTSDCQLHGFCDASERGYGCVIYLRTITQGIPTIRLLIAKSKVAPLKCVSIPRLELCGAVLLAKLIDFVKKALESTVNFSRIFAWTDSSIVLSWIRASPSRWKVFVANRVSYIHDRVLPSWWRHVPTSDNPADVTSRGLLPEDFVSSSLWWAGPSFLKLREQYWPQESPVGSVDTDLEIRKIELFVAQTKEPTIGETLVRRFSSLRKIQRIVAYCRRAVRKEKGSSLSLTAAELFESLLYLISEVQKTVFAQELSRLQRREPCSKRLLNLSPFVDEKGILRVGGRLRHSTLPSASKFPALLPSKHHLTDLLIRQIHEDNFHCGINTTMYLSRQIVWILSPRRTVRRVLSSCVRCFKAHPLSAQPKMGDLPAMRVSESKPFSCVGVDYGGPFSVSVARIRGASVIKAYLCLFICFATKAVHLEVASSLSTDAFIAALRRFVSRRGRCTHIFSDCGTNFSGANREFVKTMRTAAESQLIQWTFNPPAAPHFGGIWESGIKSVKTHLSRVVGTQIMSLEEFNTLIIQIEAMLNSRPLCNMSSDPNDLAPLTPGHFLTMEPLTSPPNPDLSHLKISRLSRWQLVQHMQQVFWRRWKNEYLHSLYQRGKWAVSKHIDNVEVGTVVLIKDDNTPPLQWRMGRIVELFPGTDYIVRVATVKTSHGTMKRPLVKLCPLPNQ